MTRLTALLLVLYIFTLSLNANTLNMKRTASITREVVMVADLMESFQGNDEDLDTIKNIVIEILPFEKRMINIPSNLVSEKIKYQFPNITLSIPSSICAVRWEEKKLSEAVLRKEAEEFIKHEFSLSPDATMDFQKFPSVVIPNENVLLSFEIARSQGNTQYTRLAGKIEYKRNVVSLFSVWVKIEDTQKVYQANRSIKKGDKISLNDFTETISKINPINALLTNLDENISFIARNFISKGSFLKSSDIVSIPAVKSNDKVTVLVETNTMQMSYQAISKTDGWLGDKIMVQNPDSKQIFYAEVIDINKVKINLED